SFTLPHGLRISSLATTRPGRPLARRPSSTRGVLPTVAVTSLRINGLPSFLARYLNSAFGADDRAAPLGQDRVAPDTPELSDPLSSAKLPKPAGPLQSQTGLVLG